MTGTADATRRLAYRPGFDGIRAVAVVGVLLFHGMAPGLPGVPGGFLGVDVFFVLSGYLITSLLLRELATRGDVSFGRFYRGRARRLLPALFAALALGAVLSLTVARDAAEQFAHHALGSLLYVTNWVFVGTEQSYFEVMGRPPLLQHLWSLAVEEQFYLLWPLFLVLLYQRGGRRAVGWTALILALTSSALMATIAFTADMPATTDAARVYFGTDTHCMGLLLGAALATAWRSEELRADLGRIRSGLLTVVGVAALAGLIAAFALVTEADPMLYQGGFLVVSLLAMVVVAVAAHPAPVFGTLLGLQPLRYLGQRSYGLYLYHWPIFLVTRPELDIPLGGWAALGVRLAVTLAVAEVSYRYLEMPVRRGALDRVWRSWRERGRVVAVGLTGLVTAAGVAVVAATGAAVSAVPSAPDVLNGVTAVGTDLAAERKAASQVVAHQPKPTPTPPLRSTTPVPQAIDYSHRYVLAIGDSVMLGAAPGVQRKLSNVWVDAEVSRDWPGIQARIDARASYGAVRSPVVIHTGTNGPAELFGLRNMVWSLPKAPVVVFVTVRTARWWMAESNENIRQLAKQFPEQVRLADWAAASAGHPEYLVSDGTHLTESGVDAYARTIRDALRGAAAAAS